MNEPSKGPWLWHCTDIFPRGNPHFKRWHLFSVALDGPVIVLAPNGALQKIELVVKEADADLIRRAWEIPELEAHIEKLEKALMIARGFVARSNEPHSVSLRLINDAFVRED